MKRDENHLNLLCDIGEMAAMLAGSADIDTVLQRIIAMVARHLQSDVCSIYLYDEPTGELVLSATQGLHPEAVGAVRLKLGKGLVGLCMAEMRPVCEASGRNNPNFEYFAETGEEAYESFLAVPIQRGVERIGVLVVQHHEANHFGDTDIMALRASASQLAGAVENARALISLHTERQKEHPRPADLPLPEEPVPCDVASGESVLAPVSVMHRTLRSSAVGDLNQTAGSRDDLHRAIDATARQLEELQERLEKKLPEIASLIFTAHLMMLKDTHFLGKIETAMQGGLTPAAAVRQVCNEFIDTFMASPHAYMQEKAADVEDLAQRMLSNLLPFEQTLARGVDGRIVVARELYPSDILKLSTENVAGLILVSGGATSHVAILARSLNLSLAIADRPELLKTPRGTLCLLDIERQEIHLRPSDQRVRAYLAREKVRKQTSRIRRPMQDVTVTRDGEAVHLLANINLLKDVNLAREFHAEGIGLYRTEFPFLVRQTFPSEDEQYVVYREMLQQMRDKPVSIRTLDVGGDKVLAYYDDAGEANPELGLRSIRFALRHPEIFEPQIRAILRAGAGFNNLRILFPMISSIDEFLEARAVVYRNIELLKSQGHAHNGRPALGAMVEIPSVVETIDAFAQEVDFFSIGTNDFVQYMLGVDRTNERVAAYYKPHHPAVLRALRRIVAAGIKHGKNVSICGEMAHEARYIPFLIGIGIRNLSVDPHFLPSTQECILNLSIPDAKAHADALLECSTIEAVEALLH